MKYQKLGQTIMEVSKLCLGTMQFGWTANEKISFAIMDAFLDAGGNFIDTADIYSMWVEGNPGGISETIIGEWMRQRKNRHTIILATKARGRMWQGSDGEGLSRTHLIRAIDDSLHRLQTDYIDLYQVHWDDESTPIEETLETLHEFVQAGKVRAIGCSNFAAARLQESLQISSQKDLARYDVLQPHYNIIHRNEYEADLRDICTEHGMGVIPYSPLAGGFLTGKYRRDTPHPESVRVSSIRHRCFNERGWSIIETLSDIAALYNCPIPQIALAWLLSQPTITAPIIGANSLEQLHKLLGAETIMLDAQHVEQITTVSEE